jgi:hypothetical protein
MALWKPKPKGIAEQGLYVATIQSTQYVGDKKTQFGVKKDWQDFVFRITQSDGELRDIHQGFPMTINKTSNFVQLLRALGISIEHVEKHGVDPDTFVGRTLNIAVYHTGAGNGLHANVKPLPPTETPKEPESEPEPTNNWQCHGLHRGGPERCLNARNEGSMFCGVHQEG